MFKSTATDRDTQPKTTHQKLKRAINNGRCCCLHDTSNEILFTINITPPFTTIAGLDVAGLWLDLPDYRTSK